QSTRRVNELVLRIGFPTRRFASASDDYARSAFDVPVVSGHRRREMHRETDGREHAFGVVNDVDQFAKISASAQVDNVCKRRMIIVSPTDLHKLNTIAEVVDNVLKPH